MDTFKLFAKTREDFPEGEMGARLDTAMDDLQTTQLTFVFFRPLTSVDDELLSKAGLTAEPLASFSGADAYLESYFVYRVTRATATNKR